jgi:hypothetical protein
MKSNETRRRYIGAMTAELAKMARTDDSDLLVYLLEMATLEAESANKKSQYVRSH